ncbi:MAG: glycogen synthase GlgA [Verrucomicrobiota bacterium]
MAKKRSPKLPAQPAQPAPTISAPAKPEAIKPAEPAASAPAPTPVPPAPVAPAAPVAGLNSLGDLLEAVIHPKEPAQPTTSAPAVAAPKAEVKVEAKPVVPVPPKPVAAAVTPAKVEVKPEPKPVVAPVPAKIAPEAKPVPPKAPAPVVPPPPKAEPVSEEKVIKEVPELKLPDEKAKDAAPVAEAPAPPRPSVAPMFVMMISPELAPVAKVGGLGDVVYGLARELEMRGNAVEIILPKYNNMRYDHIWGLTKTYENLQVPWYGGVINTSVWFGFVHGRKCFFIDPHSADNFFNRGVYYGQNDDVLRFAFFCRAALEFMLKTGKHPDVIHCHDWQTALVPVLLYEMYQHLGMRHSRACFTIHNFRHQGTTGEHILRATGLNRPEYFFHYDRLRDNNNHHAINLMKGGIVYSNFVTTVSPRHAWEAKDGGQGFGLEPTLHIHQCKYGGVLNGLDFEQFNPETDPHIPAHYNADSIEKKYVNKRALRGRFWLADNEKPIVAFIGRLDQQKGLELVRHAIFHSLNNRAQFVLLGNSPEKGINDHFLGLKHHLNDSPDCHLEIGYNEELARLIYAGADMIIVPSKYEPCGLTQLIAMRYGTVPIVRAVGGLVDTVFDKDHSSRPLHERNGYVFEHADNVGMESGLNRAIACYYQYPDHFRHLMLNAMRSDYSWNHPGQHYLNIYDYIRAK